MHAGAGDGVVAAEHDGERVLLRERREAFDDRCEGFRGLKLGDVGVASVEDAQG
jgi:hypothetical protein